MTEISYKSGNNILRALFFTLFLPLTLQAQVQTDLSLAYYPGGEAAKNLISSDPEENYFEMINNLDMHLQMKLGWDTLRDRKSALKAYRNFLISDLSEFSSFEKKKLDRLMKEAMEEISGLNPQLLPDSIALLKIRGKAYGPTAFYTRSHAIMIPATALLIMDEDELKRVLFHELFHLISREHRQLRRELYELIGFRIIKNPVQYPEPLRERMLLNPDGLALPVIAEYEKDDKKIWIAPLLYSLAGEYRPSRPQYFNYMRFALYEVEVVEGGGLQILSSPDGQGTAPAWAYDAFRKAITDNTGYIIHPDEIMADNFTLLFTRRKEKERGLSTEGKKLLEGVENKLKNYKSAD